jgi:hypothetical protein
MCITVDESCQRQILNLQEPRIGANIQLKVFYEREKKRLKKE